MSGPVRNHFPPAALGRIVNPMLRTLVRSPLGRAMKSLAVLEMTGRRSGRRIRVVIGWHEVDGAPTVFSPSAWRNNFVGGAPAVLHHRGTHRSMVGTLVTDPATVAAAIAAVLADGTSPRAIALDVDAGHVVTPDDVVAVNRAMIRFT